MTDTHPATTHATAPEQHPHPSPRTAAPTPAIPVERLQSLLSGTELRQWLAGVSCAEGAAAGALLRHLVQTP